MGLDMYLEKKTYVKNWEHTKPEEKYTITIKMGKKKSAIDPEKITYIIEEAGYWRKANAIHNWFVQNVQDGEDDCKQYFVSIDDLESLLKTVRKVLKNKSLAPELLPTKEGFFFGGTEYDDYYWEDLEHTEKILKEALKKPITGNFYYHSSW